MSIFTNRGISIPRQKEPAASRAVEELQTSGQVLIPLSYGEAKVCQLTVKPYATVMRGQVIGTPVDPQDAPAIATVTGVLAGTRSVDHPLFGRLECAVVDGMVTGGERPAARRKKNSPSPQEVIEAAKTAAIIDEVDGAQLHLKLAAWQEEDVPCLAADGTEPETYASSAWAVLSESAEEVQAGLRLAAEAVLAGRCHVAAQLPAEPRRALLRRLGEDGYYQTRRRYPPDRYAKAGGPVHRMGVQACLALNRAVTAGESHCDCVVTVAGDAVASPRNLRVPFGTPVEALLTHCGLSADPHYVILGDSMTGVAAPDISVPVLPGITCVLALTARQAAEHPGPCMGCGRCAQVCHAGLLPYEIVRRLENMHYERLASLLPEECDGCGACSHVCPAGREVAAMVQEAAGAHSAVFLDWGDDDDA